MASQPIEFMVVVERRRDERYFCAEILKNGYLLVNYSSADLRQMFQGYLIPSVKKEHSVPNQWVKGLFLACLHDFLDSLSFQLNREITAVNYYDDCRTYGYAPSWFTERNISEAVFTFETSLLATFSYTDKKVADLALEEKLQVLEKRAKEILSIIKSFHGKPGLKDYLTYLRQSQEPPSFLEAQRLLESNQKASTLRL